MVKRNVVVSGGFQDGDFEGICIWAASGGRDFRDSNASLVFHDVNCLPELAGHGGRQKERIRLNFGDWRKLNILHR